MTGWGRWSLGNCVQNLNLTILRNVICYIHNSESALEKEMHRFLWGFEIQTNHQNLSKKANMQNSRHFCQATHRKGHKIVTSSDEKVPITML